MSNLVQHIRQVNRAASDLRHGIPVILLGNINLAILAVETCSAEALAEFESFSSNQSLLLMTRMRAAAVSQNPAHLYNESVLLNTLIPFERAKIYHSLANPTMPQDVWSIQIANDLITEAETALRLIKVANLLPVLLIKVIPSDASLIGCHHNIIKLLTNDFLLYDDEKIPLLQQVAIASIQICDAPDTRFIAFRSHTTSLEHIAVLVGHPELCDAPLVRLHSECFTGDLLASMRCDCGEQLRGAIRKMAIDGAGILIYLAQEGRGIGLTNKLRAYNLQDRGLDTLDANQALGWDADERNFFIGAGILSNLGIKRIRLLTNNPQKISAMIASNIEVVRRESHLFAPNGVNDDYIATKAARFDHWLET